MSGFFSASKAISSAPPRTIAACGACKRDQNCLHPRISVTGLGKKKILIVGDAPDAAGDKACCHFVGPVASSLHRWLSDVGIDWCEDCWFTNALICADLNRPFDLEQVDFCRPNLMSTIRQLDPVVVITLGHAATTAVIAPHFKERIGDFSRWVGWKIPLQKGNYWVCPMYHPKQAIESAEKDREGAVYLVWLKRHLKEAVEKARSRPYTVVPDYESQVQCVYDEKKIKDWIRKILERESAIICPDYETNVLKPETRGARLHTVAIKHREETIAFPYTPRLKPALAALMKSHRVKKIGANTKFEDRWTRCSLGVEMNGIIWDTMEMAHLLDNRRGITSVKFQGFVRCGISPWNKHIEPFFDSDGATDFNRIDEIDLHDCLIYNGVDTIVEVQVAKSQREEFELQRGGS